MPLACKLGWVLCRRREWDWRRGYRYLHSTFCDLAITGLVGLRPASDASLVLNPLVPEEVKWFALDNVLYHGMNLAIAFDREGSRYGHGVGLFVWVNGQLVANSSHLQQLSIQMPAVASV